MQIEIYAHLVPLIIGLGEVYKYSTKDLSDKAQITTKALFPSFIIIISVSLASLLYGVTGSIITSALATALTSMGLFATGRSTVNATKYVLN